jgi:hypothetical protein
VAELPAPLVPADVDLSEIDGFLLRTDRLLESELWALSTGDEFKAAVGLWCHAWNQRPPASLPDDDRVLMSFAGVRPLARWRKLKPMAMRGFVKCSDGRFYHKVLAQDAMRAWERRQAYRERSAKANGMRWRGKIQEGDHEHIPRAIQQGVLDGSQRKSREGEGKEGNPYDNHHDTVLRASDPVPSTAGFAEFWAVYPRHVGKRSALIAYASACNRAPHSAILEGARRYALSREGQDQEYTKAPGNWLEGDHWADEAPAERITEAERIARRYDAKSAREKR